MHSLFKRHDKIAEKTVKKLFVLILLRFISQLFELNGLKVQLFSISTPTKSCGYEVICRSSNRINIGPDYFRIFQFSCSLKWFSRKAFSPLKKKINCVKCMDEATIFIMNIEEKCLLIIPAFHTVFFNISRSIITNDFKIFKWIYFFIWKSLIVSEITCGPKL